MKINIIFLLMGLALSLISKLLQYMNKLKLGNALVIPAAIFFVLAIVFSIPKIQRLLDKADGLRHVISFSIWACIGVVSFQVMMMLLIGNGNKLALFLLVPFLLAVYIVIQKWKVF